ncbi:MAG: MBL fold metallo-hydrolase [Candidatus Heimdallarchaeota archaeon]|nr:MBL fold metallo-hydrolase [Candidatus Heimdallarchaeota archaeon]MCK4769501.1 MBL fold metallo-hydrolase [Candidatus Heimdallarchaeota archaeon]
MSLTKTTKLILIISSSFILVGAAIATPTTLVLLNKNKEINFTLLENAGVMIEAKGLRIYVDPINLPDNYSDLPADAILITHGHGDHYQSNVMTMLQKEDTLNVFPAIYDTYVALFDGLAVVPGDSFQVGSIEVTCFYMYTFAPPGYDASHAQADNYTSYLIDIDGFTFFHAGDSGNIPEYSELNGLVDVALMPLGPGCQTMADMDIVYALDAIDPSYFVPIHFVAGAESTFCETYRTSIENLNCEIVQLSHFSSRTFSP